MEAEDCITNQLFAFALSFVIFFWHSVYELISRASRSEVGMRKMVVLFQICEFFFIFFYFLFFAS